MRAGADLVRSGQIRCAEAAVLQPV